MFDIGWTEMLVIAVLALIIIGPKDLPKAMRTVGQWVRKARSLAREFQSGVDEMIRESELDEARKTLEATKRSNIGKTIREHVDPDGELGDEAKRIEDTARQTTRLDDPETTAVGSKGKSRPEAKDASDVGASGEGARDEGAGARGTQGGTGEPETAGEPEPEPSPASGRVVRHPAKVAPGNSIRPPQDEVTAGDGETSAPSPSKAGGSAV